MIKRLRINPLSIIFCLLFLSACTLNAAPGSSNTDLTIHTLEYKGIERTYLVQIPEAGAEEPFPLIIALHGGGGTARSMCAMPGGLTEPALREGFLLICPEGIERHWNDGRGIQTWRAHAEDIDDAGFLMALVDHLSHEFSIDPERIFATGISNGGQMSYRLACEHSRAIQGIAAVAASMATKLDCNPSAPVSVMVINGTRDPLVPYNGGEIKAMRRGLGEVRPTSEVLNFWVERNNCNLPGSRALLPDQDTEDGTRIYMEEYPSCDADTHVVLYKVLEGGHTWPGANQYLPEFIIGRLSADIKASEVIIDFFSTH